jgi:Zn-finger nucleic acid-binding protein
MARIEFKIRKVPMAVCPVCDTTLSGDNSNWSPYHCAACKGIWKAKWINPDEFTFMQEKEDVN